MGIRESLLNTITSVSNGDFIRVVTSAGASSKATLANVIKSFETGLGEKSSLGTSDYIRVVGSDNALYKQSVSAVKTAMGIDTLDDRTKVYSYTQSTGSFLDWVRSTFTTNGEYYVVMESSNYDGWATGAVGTCIVQKRNAYWFLLACVNESNQTDVQSIWLNRYNGSTWIGWSRTPRKQELDALNSKCGYVSLSTNILTYAESLPAGADIVAYFNGTDYTWLPNQDPNYRYGLFHITKGATVCLVDAYSWNGALHKYNFYGNNAWHGWR